MPIRWIDSQPEKRCSALSKATKQRCLNPAAYGCKTCRMHGARKSMSIKRGKDHPNYKHGNETIDRKQQRIHRKQQRIHAHTRIRNYAAQLKNLGAL